MIGLEYVWNKMNKLNTQIGIQSTKLMCMDFCAAGVCKVVLTALLWHQILILLWAAVC